MGKWSTPHYPGTHYVFCHIHPYNSYLFLFSFGDRTKLQKFFYLSLVLHDYFLEIVYYQT